MGKKIVILSLLAALITTSAAFAHDQALHHGKPVMGNVTAVNNDGFVMQVDTEALQVKLLPETKFETGMNGEPGTRAAVKIGAHAMVYGTKLETGELVAKEVMVHDMKTPPQAPASHDMPMGNMNHDMSRHGSH